MKLTFTNKKDSIHLQQILESNKYQNWIKKITTNYVVKEVFIHKVSMFGTKVGFLYVEANVTDFQGNRLPGISFIRGDSVAILVVITEKETGFKYLAMVEEPRVPAGEIVLSIPAGMLDEGEVKGTSIKELQEEIGSLNFKEEDLVFLEEGFPSPGGSDEKITIYSYDISLSKKEIDEINEKQTGEGDNEVITVKVIPFDQTAITKTSSMIAKTAMYAYIFEGKL